MPDDSCSRIAPFLLGPATPLYGIWLFYANQPDLAAAGARGLGRFADTVTVSRPTPRYFVVRSRETLPPRALVELGVRLRQAWQTAVPENTRVAELLAADREALRAPNACPAYPAPEELGDPGTSPHWPPVKGPQ
jgi:hypothetical protein